MSSELIGWSKIKERVSALFVTKKTLDANTILYATTDDTPAALAVGASTIVGRKATGNVVAMTPAEAWGLLGSGLTKITVGATEPTSPTVGDLWVDVS